MGGLITVTSILAGETRIRKVFTLGTPYEGTYLFWLGYGATILVCVALAALYSPLLGMLYLLLFSQIPSVWQMKPDSAFLRSLLDRVWEVPNLQCIYAVRDQIVICNPWSVWAPTRLGRVDDICVPEHGHMNLFMGEAPINFMARLLELHETVDPPGVSGAEGAKHDASSHAPCVCCGRSTASCPGRASYG
jgi:hypothetical protein